MDLKELDNESKELHDLSMKANTNKNLVYNKWANSYDEYVNKFEYRGPNELVRLLNLYNCHFESESDNLPISVLDFGCGTGLLGEAFYRENINMVGVDISEKMLEKSRARNIYSNLVCLDITKEDDFKDVLDKMNAPSNGFNLVMSCGVFLEGHVSLAEINRMILKLVKKGGVLAFTVRHSFMESEEKFFMKLLFNTEIIILAKAKINYLKDVEAWAIIIKRL